METLTIVAKIKRLLITLEDFKIIHVWREANQPADIMASMFMNDEEIVLLLNDFPVNLIEAISNNVIQCTYTRL